MLTIQEMSFRFGRHVIIDRLDLRVAEAEVLAIVGPSGCGKSTLLRLIAGLEEPNQGSIIIGHRPDSSEGLSFLFQDYDAFPWLTVWENVWRFSSKNQHPFEDTRDMLEKVGLWESRQRYPAELSLGMRKRLALARCLVRRPSLLLLDEPFSNLDVNTREEMYSLLQAFQERYEQTVIVVTHNIHEAILIGTKVLIATTKPFRVAKLVDIPFEFPRTEDITTSTEYQGLAADIRAALRQYPRPSHT